MLICDNLDMKKNTSGFTIIELLIVIAVIGILAAISIVAYSGLRDKAVVSKIKADLSQIQKAVITARTITGKTAIEIATRSEGYGGGGPAAACLRGPSLPSADLTQVPKTDGCWTTYTYFLEDISNASGINIRNILDPWSRPYAIVLGERPTNCYSEEFWTYSVPVSGWGGRYKYSETVVKLPRSGLNPSCP